MKNFIKNLQENGVDFYMLSSCAAIITLMFLYILHIEIEHQDKQIEQLLNPCDTVEVSTIKWLCETPQGFYPCESIIGSVETEELVMRFWK